MNIGEFNRRVVIHRWGSAKDDAGGVEKVEIGSWTKWAKVEQRSGMTITAENQTQFRYDYKVTLRYESSRPTVANYTLTYDNLNMMIHSVAIDSEGNRRFEVLRCSVTGTNNES